MYWQVSFQLLLDNFQKIEHDDAVLKEDTESLTAAPTDPRRGALRIGIAGGGFMARVHSIAARAAGARIVGAAGSAPDRSEAARDVTRAEVGYRSVAHMLEDADLDVLHVCAPNVLHHELSLAAATRGVHVICEKPLTSTVDGADELVAAIAAAGVTGAVPFVYRFHPMVRELAARLSAGDAGTVGLITGSYLQDWLADPTESNWRVDPASGGASRAFADIGSHWFDLLEFVRGVRVARLSARFATVFPTRGTSGDLVTTEDSCTVQFEMVDGVIGTFAASQVARGRKNRLSIEVSGDRHSFFFDQENPEAMWVGAVDGNRMLLRDPAALSADAARFAVLPAGHAQGYQDCFNAFVADAYDAVRGGASAGLPTFADGRRSAQIVAAVAASAASGGTWIDLTNPEDAR